MKGITGTKYLPWSPKTIVAPIGEDTYIPVIIIHIVRNPMKKTISFWNNLIIIFLFESKNEIRINAEP